ncbi:hypothetical protein VP01_4396g3 [Puccinia sorghi]|uniref:Uncharacterized protein n=1 Tax=Puccinia sorghi TaxID=27349 RepID=A0A0L6UPN7_9BASI|nr:hypothetical protein VP01_4396g3 [Puccinia sorghi]
MGCDQIQESYIGFLGDRVVLDASVSPYSTQTVSMNDSVASKNYLCKLPTFLVDMEERVLHKYITTYAAKFYKDSLKQLQFDSVTQIVKDKNVVFQDGTDFGKTRISEDFFNLFKTKVVLTEKVLVKIPKKNLNKMNFSMKVVRKIQVGSFSFVCLSPEFFLNSSLFNKLFFSHEFQKKLALVFFEANMIYSWVFWPLYRCMVTCLMATNNVPLLILSATCWPIEILNGELTQPKILYGIPFFSQLFLLFSYLCYGEAQDGGSSLIWNISCGKYSGRMAIKQLCCKKHVLVSYRATCTELNHTFTAPVVGGKPVQVIRCYHFLFQHLIKGIYK